MESHRTTNAASESVTPWPLPLVGGPECTVLAGGGFDPPHKGHVGLAVAARDWLERARGGRVGLVFVPSAWSPLKAGAPMAPGVDRAAMTRLAIEGVSDAAVWTDEIDRDGTGPSYTVDTLRRARMIARRVELRLLIGADQAVVFHRWREFREVLQLAEPLVLGREPWATPVQLAKALRETGAWTDGEIERWMRWCVPGLAVVDVSSTRVRDALAAGVAAADLAELAPSVAAYIEARGLYRK